jgi:type IV secretory pathway TrbF-like protein
MIALPGRKPRLAVEVADVPVPARDARSRIIAESRRKAGDRVKNAYGEARGWRLAFFLTFALLTAVVAALGFLTLYPQRELYVVAVDRLGVQAPLEPASQARLTDPAIVAAELNRWIINIRSVTTDVHAQERMVRQAYAYVGPQAAKLLNAYFRDPANDPRLLAQKGSRLVEVRMAQPLHPDSPTWVVMWDEQVINPSSGSAERTTWQAYLTVKQVVYPRKLDARAEEQRRLNPFGLYIMELNWSRISNPSNLQRGLL